MVLSQALINAARDCDLAAVQEFLAEGGDPNERIGPGNSDSGETLLHVVAGIYVANPARVEEMETRICAIVRALLAAGATVDALREKPKNTPLLTAIIYGRTEMVRLLCQAGADVNYRRLHTRWHGVESSDFPLVLALQHPDVARVLLQFGADPLMKGPLSLTLEELAVQEERNSPQYGEEFRESARLIKNARLLRPRLRGVFALRALCTRGRAWPTPTTPAAFARLIGGGTSRPRTRAAAKVPASPGLPDPLAHLVCKFWLGEPPRRRAAAAAPTSE